MFEPLALAACLGCGLTAVGMPAYISTVKRLGFGQRIREEGPQDHQSKAGTPTMGGGLFVPMGLLAACCFGGLTPDVLVLVLITMGSWGLGLTDDLTKVFKDRNLGLKARHKLAIQSLLALLLGAWVAYTMPHPGIEVPFLGFLSGWGWLLLFAWLVVSGTTNAVNLTDGQDGLAGGTVICSLLAYAAICACAGRLDLAAAAAGMAGAVMGFLWFNCYPARIFMGDTGSLGLGGLLSCLAMMTHTEFVLVIVGGVFVIEALSVILQVTYFKLTKGQRIFRMSPIHHHYTLGGMHEVQVTVRFWLVSAALAGLGLYLHFRGLL